MTDCCTYRCNQGRDCPVRRMPVAKPVGMAASHPSHPDHWRTAGEAAQTCHTHPLTGVQQRVLHIPPAERAGVDGGNFWLTSTVPPAVDLAAVRARAAQAKAARLQGQDDPAGTASHLDDGLHATIDPADDDHGPGIWAAIFGVAALVAFIGIVAGYLWRLYGPTVLELINRHAATLGMPG